MMGTTRAGRVIQVSYTPCCTVVMSILKLLLTFKKLHAFGGKGEGGDGGAARKTREDSRRKSLLQQLLSFHFFKGSF